MALIKEYNMKQKISVIFLAAVLLFAACKPQLDPPADFEGNPEDIGLTVELLHLTLDKTELATIGGNPLKLIVTKTPEFATGSKVKWVSSNINAATVEEYGDGTISTNANVTGPETTVIRVESTTDSSVYAECPLTVYPNYGSNRYWNFGASGWYASSADAAQKTPFGAIVFTADTSLGNGMTLKGQTGSGSYENPTETPNGLPLAGGLIPQDAAASTYPPYPWVYEIDPANPYAAGLTPTNNTRSGMGWNDATNVGSIGFGSGSLVTNGAGRIFSIAALQGPFYIEVRYTTNSNNAARWADIRIGDTSGFRIQGSPSSHTTNAGSGGTASYKYTNDDVVPFVYIESQASIRIYDVTIKTDGPEIPPGYRPIGSVSISGDSSVKNGGTITLSSVLTPADATGPVYSWTVTGSGAAIDGSATGATVKIKGAADSGSVTVKLAVTTTDPDTNVKTTKNAPDKVITLEAASSGGGDGGDGGGDGAYFYWNAATSAAFNLTSSSPTATISGKTWRRGAGTITFTAGSAGLALADGRFLIGSGSATNTSSTVYDTAGELDFSTKKKISITYTAASASGNFVVYINNNTTTQSNSVLGSSNRIQNGAPVTPGATWTYTVDPVTFGNHDSLAKAFLQIRCDSSASIVISKILIEDVN